jgi:hypothetical protein
MQTKAKANSVLTHRVEEGAIFIKVKDAGELKFVPGLASEACRARAELHGWIQRISDAAALGRDPKSGQPASPQAKLEAMKKLVDHYESGAAEWRMAGGGGGGSSAIEKALLVRCLVVVYPTRTEEQLTEWVGKRTSAERTALLSSEKIKALADKFRAEQSAGIDADGLLSEFDDSDETTAESEVV